MLLGLSSHNATKYLTTIREFVSVFVFNVLATTKIIIGPHHEKTCLGGVGQSEFQISSVASLHMFHS